MGRLGARFVIQELLPVAAPYVGGEPARFEWDVEHRNVPHDGLNFGLQLRSKRTDYPGSTKPSEQVLGAHFKDFSVSGRWLDKWNYPGYANETRQLFEQLVTRGNLCRIEFLDYRFVGLIKDVDFDVKNAIDVGYTFAVSVHEEAAIYRNLGFGERVASGGFVSPRDHAAAVEDMLEAMLPTHTDPVVGEIPGSGSNSMLPTHLQGTTLHGRAIRLVKQIDERVQSLKASVDAAVINPVSDAASALLTIASGFALIRGACQSTIDELAAIRSDEQASMSALETLNFDTWRLGIQGQCFVMMGRAYQAEQQAVAQAKPDILRIHEAKSGDTLIKLSLLYYGTVDSWQVIADRNGMVGATVTPGAFLIIPQGPRR